MTRPDLDGHAPICDMPSLESTPTVSAAAVLFPRPAAAATEKHTYPQILKSTALIGGSSAVNIVSGIIRTKAMALFLGPSGVGLMGVYSTIAELAVNVAGMGIQSSGVRQIAEAVGSGDKERIARTAVVLRRISLLLGVLGAVLLLTVSGPVSHFTFGARQQASSVALLSLAVLFRLVSAGQSALIQGMRRISDLATMSVLAALFSTLISIPMAYLFREQGVVPSLVAVAAVSILTSWWYSRKIQIQVPSLTFPQVTHEVAGLLKLGFAFMASGLLMMGAAYVIRIIVLRTIGLSAAGLYQSAWALGGLYIGFILQAMGTDFYPRLTGVSKDNAECNRMVNEQAQMSMLLAAPGIIATLTFAPLVVGLFYSAEFYGAIGLLRWICLGMILRVVAWPMGFIVLAKGAQKTFFWSEIAATVVHVGLAWLFVNRFGLTGAGAAFFCLYVWHALFIYTVVRYLSGFQWSAMSRRLGLVYLPLVGLVFCGFYVLPSWLATTIGIAAVLVSGAYSLGILIKVLPLDSMPPVVAWCVRRFDMAVTPDPASAPTP